MKVVERCEPARGGVAQHHVEPALGLAGKHGNAHVPASIEINRLPVQHRQTPRYVEATNGNLYPGLAERSGDVEGTRVLVRLDADESDQSEIAVAAKTARSAGTSM